MRKRYLIVGNGVAGVTSALALVQADPAGEVHLFGSEPYPYYRRPQLWEFIAGRISEKSVFQRPAEWYSERGIVLHLGTAVTAVDPQTHRVTLGDGSVKEYDRLLLATGGRPFIPACEGADKEGVFALRTLEDARRIRAYLAKVARAIVMGGGLLGLETAYALITAGVNATVVECFPHLLPRHLDAEGACILQSALEKRGIQIVTGASIAAVIGSSHVEGIAFRDGGLLPGNMVVFAAGMQSETTLARAAGVPVNRGIVVDAYMQTSVPDLFAAGDAAEFNGTVYGLIPPAMRQGRVAASNMVNPGSSTFSGGNFPVTLNIGGLHVTSVGKVIALTENHEVFCQEHGAEGRYGKFVVQDGRLVGAILINEPEKARVVVDLVAKNVDFATYAGELL